METKHKREHGHQLAPWHRNLHHDWRLWLVVGVMLFAMVIYVLSDNERFGFGGGAGKVSAPVPAMAP